jgi:hypothetical protein
MFTHTINISYVDDAGMVPGAVGNKYNGQNKSSWSGSIAATTTDQFIDLAFPTSGMQSIWIWSDTNLTVKTNSSSSPTQTIALVANTPVYWGTGLGLTNPITAAVTSLYVTNATANAAKFELRALST